LRTKLAKISVLAIAVAVYILIVRLAVTASPTETGWQTVISQWKDGMISWTGLTADPIGEREPIDQAQFWTREVERVVNRHPDSASIHIGAAWMLDSSNPEFVQNHMLQREQSLPQFALTLDENSISSGKAKFREMCSSRCTILSTRATELEPDVRHYWRMRAMLLFEGDTFLNGQAFEPRLENWIEILDECIAHDKDNALYDYLAALTLWKQSATYNIDFAPGEADSQFVLNIENESQFASGVERFQRAQERKYLAIGEEGYESIAEFLSLCHVSKSEQSSAALSRVVTYRQSYLFYSLWRWQHIRADAGSDDDAIAIHQQTLRMYDQATIPEETSALNLFTSLVSLRKATYSSICTVALENPAAISEESMGKIRTREEEFRIESATLLSAIEQLHKEKYPPENQVSVAAIVSSVASSSSALLFIIGALLISIGMGFTRKKQKALRLGVIRQTLVWGIGCGGTFILLGMAPAEVISHDNQSLIIVAAVWSVALAFVGLIVWFVVVLLRRRQFQYQLTTLFAVMTGAAVLAGFLPLIQTVLSWITEHPPELGVHPKGWKGIDAEVLRTATKQTVGSWAWAVVQWFAYGGLYIEIIVSLALGGFWLMWADARQAKTRFFKYWTSSIRIRWPALARSIGRSAVSASVCWLLIYLCFAPQFIRETEAKFQQEMRYCRDPLAHYSEIREAQAAIGSSQQVMKSIREHVEIELKNEGKTP